MKKACIYQPDEGKYMLLSGLLTSIGAEIVRMTEKDAAVPVARILGLSVPFNAPAAKEAAPSFLPAAGLTVLCGLTGEELDAFLAAKKAAGITGTGLLAVATPMNIAWTVSELAGELQREHEEIMKAERRS